MVLLIAATLEPKAAASWGFASPAPPRLRRSHTAPPRASPSTPGPKGAEFAPELAPLRGGLRLRRMAASPPSRTGLVGHCSRLGKKRGREAIWRPFVRVLRAE